VSDHDRNVLDFVVFLLYRVAERWGWSVPATYGALSATGILDAYVVPCFDTLHTMGTEALVEDITDFAREKGVAV
jgi:hypothetical protein